MRSSSRPTPSAVCHYLLACVRQLSGSNTRDLVDSVRLGNPTAGFWKTLGLVIGLPLVAVVVICRSDDCQMGD